MKNGLIKFFKNEEGQAMTEYGLIIALVAVVVIVVLGAIGTNINTKFTDIRDALE